MLGYLGRADKKTLEGSERIGAAHCVRLDLRSKVITRELTGTIRMEFSEMWGNR